MPGTFTNDFEWRYKLQNGDLVDCLDSEGTWYVSTVLEIRETKVGDGKEAPIKEVYIGYRYYDPEGHKVEEETKERFVGWSARYDIWLPITSPQIQRCRTVSRFYKAAGRSTMIYDDHAVTDTSDVLSNSEKPYPCAVSRSNHF
jgi:hypothetical protein